MHNNDSIQDTVIILLVIVLTMLIMINLSIYHNKEKYKTMTGIEYSKWVNIDNVD